MSTLSDAITAVEASQTTLTNADTAMQQAQQKFDAAQSGLSQSQTDDADAAKTANAALDALIAAATAAKR